MSRKPFVMPVTHSGTPVHRVILLWCCAGFMSYAALQTGYRFWLLQVGDAVVGEVSVAQDSCMSRKRANCFLGRAVVNPRMANHRFKTTKIPGGRFYDEGEELPMRVYPSEQRLYLAAVYTPLNWLLGPVRFTVVALLLLFGALMPAPRIALWVVPCVLAVGLTLG
ncbi:MAG: hypothetical protein Q7J29_08040 [Stagnimonas sp.]|nr:hypothetical protein [Stagnimonas sp.]